MNEVCQCFVFLEEEDEKGDAGHVDALFWRTLQIDGNDRESTTARLLFSIAVQELWQTLRAERVKASVGFA